jgi:hypothetical protein
MTRPLPALACATLLALGACGDPLADGSWRGRPLLTLEGWVHLAVTPEAYADLDWLREGELRAALFWAPTRGSSYSLARAVEQDVSAVGSFPARFALTIHEPPPDALLHLTEAGTPFAVGLVVAYRDLDGDGRWDRDAERLVGGVEDRFVLYAPRGLQDAALGDRAPGFHRITPVLACDAPDGTVHYVPDAGGDLILSVGRGFPAEIALRLACDGEAIAWQGACPPLPQVRARCADPRSQVGEAPDPMCVACRGLLAPLGVDPATCRRWLEDCLTRLPAEECEREASLCAGRTEPPPEGPPCDAVCTCQRTYEACLDAHPDEREACQRRLEACLAAPAP